MCVLVLISNMFNSSKFLISSLFDCIYKFVTVDIFVDHPHLYGNFNELDV